MILQSAFDRWVRENVPGWEQAVVCSPDEGWNTSIWSRDSPKKKKFINIDSKAFPTFCANARKVMDKHFVVTVRRMVIFKHQKA
jgi:hypothetical protein